MAEYWIGAYVACAALTFAAFEDGNIYATHDGEPQTMSLAPMVFFSVAWPATWIAVGLTMVTE